jgi:hypothetical protein
MLDRLLVEVRRVERDGIVRPELEDVPDLDRGAKRERTATARAAVPLAREPDVGGAAVEVPATLDAAVVIAGAIRPGDELALAQCLVDDDLPVEADRAERPGLGAERLDDLVDLGRPDVAPENRGELGVVEPVVAADERKHDFPVRDDRHRLGRRGQVDAEQAGEVLASRSPASRLGRRGERLGNDGARGTPCAISRSVMKSPRSP